MIFIIFNQTSYPEDHENYLYIENVYDDKIEAFKKLIEISSENKSLYSHYFIREYEEDVIIESSKKYTSYKNFILNNKEVVYHVNNPEFIEKNNNLCEKVKKLHNLIDEINNLFLKKYNDDMILYKEGKIKHPVLKNYNKYFVTFNPLENEEFKKFDNYIDSLILNINNKKNDFNII